MTADEVMNQLEELGTAQNRKVYARHGAGDTQFGVSFANLNALKKRIKIDQDLAEELWATGNTDARSLATMIADPQAFSSSQLDAWLRGLTYYGLIDIYAHNIVSKTTYAETKANRWTESKDEWVGRAGWTVLADLALQGDGIPDATFEAQLGTIESSIATAPNRTREAMNRALIAIGSRNAALRTQALAAAARIGKVEIDHGETGCKTPDATAYIERTWARKRAKAVTTA